MSKKKKARARKATNSPTPSPKAETLRKKLADSWAVFLAALTLISGIVGIWLGYVILPPKVEITAPKDFFEPSDPFSGEFEVRNEGTFSIYNVQIKCIF